MAGPTTRTRPAVGVTGAIGVGAIAVSGLVAAWHASDLGGWNLQYAVHRWTAVGLGDVAVGLALRVARSARDGRARAFWLLLAGTYTAVAGANLTGIVAGTAYGTA